MRCTLFILAAVSILVGLALAEPPQTWRVVTVTDGDTVRCVDPQGQEVKVRLVGIDAPERGQPFGTVARDALRDLVLRR
jgi:endonuclease YncB( thermonuclease family)